MTYEDLLHRAITVGPGALMALTAAELASLPDDPREHHLVPEVWADHTTVGHTLFGRQFIVTDLPPLGMAL